MMTVMLSSASGGGAPGAPAPAGLPPALDRPAGMGTEAPDRSLMARCLAYLFGAGAALALVAFALPNNSQGTATQIFIPETSYALAAVAVVAILLVSFDRLPLWTFQFTLAAGAALISFVIYVSGDPTSAYTMFYVWIALYAFYFFSLPQACFQLTFVAVSYGAVLHFNDGLAVPTARWLITVGTIASAGVLVAMLKARVATLVDRLSASARTDPLTGLLNRRGFEEYFEYELERARRGSGRLSIVLLDLDYFKVVNDRFGHAVGDDALERLGGVLTATKRQIDTAARVGGEEFALLLPESDADGAFTLCERIRKRVSAAFAEAGFRSGEKSSSFPLTVSLGVASFPLGGTTQAELLSSADRALYEAKRQGRDRTVLHAAVAS